MKLLETSPEGLTEEEVPKRRKIYVLDIIEEFRKLSPLRMFLRQFQNALNYILALAAVISIIEDNKRRRIGVK